MNTLEKTKYTIYQIKHNDPTVCLNYVGSTTDFNQRESVHKFRTRNIESYKCLLYKTIRESGGWDSFNIQPVETLECDRREAEAREGYWIKTLSANMNTYNKSRATTTSREYHKQYYLDNREKILEKINANYNYVKVAPKGRST